MYEASKRLAASLVFVVLAGCSNEPGPAVTDAGSPDTADASLADALVKQDEPDIATDAEVIFGRVPPRAGDPEWAGEWRRMTVQNLGTAPLEISDIRVTGSDNFRLTYPTPDAHVNDVESDTDVWPETLVPDASFDVRVWFKPDDNLPEQATLIFESDDPDDSLHEVPVWGQGGTPCLQVSPRDEINLAQGEPGQVVRERVYLRNCGRSKPVTISRVELVDDAGGRFELREIDTPLELEVTGETFFEVTFESVDDQTHSGRLLITSDDPGERQRYVPIYARGSADTECPFAKADAWVEGSEQRTRPIVTTPLQTVHFSASASSDSDGTVERYEWTLLSRPYDSTQSLLPAPDASETRLFLDIVGTYEVQLEVYDDDGNKSCNQRQIVTIEAIPEDDLYMELVWDTPSDTDQTDYNGTDLDLHYLHPHGEWDHAPWDVFCRNPMPDWGMQDDHSDDPVLEIDDTDGAGPDIIRHNHLENATYRVGVYYYSPNDFGASYPTVRIYVEGELARVLDGPYMPGTGAFWEVATIEGPEAVITPVDELYEGFPGE